VRLISAYPFVGSVGRYMTSRPDEINTYMSIDAGMTWKEVAKGSYTYEFGDYGSLVVMAKNTVPTNTIMYDNLSISVIFR
jgi:hypothetical protein